MALGTLTVRIRADIAGLTTGLAMATAQVRRAGVAMQNVGQQMQNVGRQMSMALTLPVAAFGAAIGRSAAQFEAAMIRVQALSNASAAQLRDLTAIALRMGATTKFTATDAADALGFMSMAGMRAEQSLAALPGVLQLAASAGLSLADAADIVTNVLSGYRLEVEQLSRVNDVLVSTFTATNTSLSQLGQAMKYAGPVAAQAGVSFETAAAMIGLMGNAGIQGSMAGTSLRGALARLAAPTDQVKNAMAAAGIETRRFADGGIDIVDMIRQLESHSNDAGLFLTIFGQRAGPALAAVVGQGSEALDHLITRLEAARGTAERVADSYNQGLQGALYGLQSAIEGVGLAFASSGLSKFFEDVVRQITSAARAFSQLNPIWLRTIAIVAGIVAAIGPLIWVLGGLTRAIGGLIVLLTGPQGILILLAGLVVAAAAAGWMSKLSEEVRGAEDAAARARSHLSRLAELNREIAESGHDAADATRRERDEILEVLRVDAMRARQEARRLEALAPAGSLDPGSRDWWLNPQVGVDFVQGMFGESASDRAARARADADAAWAAYSDAGQASRDADTLPERRAAYLRAQASREQWRRDHPGAGDGDFEAWSAANPGMERALRDTGAAPPTSRTTTATEELIDLNGAGGGPPLPSVERSQTIASLTELNRIAPTTRDEIARLAEIEDQFNESQNRGENFTREQIAAWVDERDELQRQIDKRVEMAETELENERAHKALTQEIQSQTKEQEELTQAALEGEDAYNRLLIVQRLLRENPFLTREEAEAMADGIQAATDRLGDAVERMQRFSQLWDQLGQAVGSAFEKAILDGEKLSDVLKSLVRDIAALVLRATVTEPIANAISGFLGGIFRRGGGGSTSGSSHSGSGSSGFWSSIGNGIMNFFSGFFADGGYIPPGKWGIAGEAGAEPVFGGRTGATVIPANANGGAYTIDARTYISAPGADAAQLARVEARLGQLQRELPARIRGQMANLNARGRGWTP